MVLGAGIHQDAPAHHSTHRQHRGRRSGVAGIVGQNGGMNAVPQPRGTGPGAITPDGCAVDFYAMMPDFGEPAIVHEAAGPGVSILELGCGAGRVTHPLIALGHPVVAVDESPEMLAHVHGAETVCARIQDLSLGRRFGAVLLASHLINADDETRRSFLDACRRHVADDGCVIIQQYSPSWFESARDSEVTREGVILRMRDVTRPAPNLLSATVEYVAGNRRWTQTFTTMRLDEAELAAALDAAGMRLDRYLTEDRSWFRAVPVRSEQDRESLPHSERGRDTR
jgi:SAM-dependent methyltransferase